MRNTSRILALAALTLALSSSLLAATWSGWKLVEGGGVTDAAVAGTAYNGSIHLFAKAADRKLYHNRGAGNGTGWGSWSEVPGGGYTDAAPAAATQGGKLRPITARKVEHQEGDAEEVALILHGDARSRGWHAVMPSNSLSLSRRNRTRYCSTHAAGAAVPVGGRVMRGASSVGRSLPRVAAA